jgi:hypothetical protein
MKKLTYHIRNWSEYNASLKKRGGPTLWVRSEAVENWTTIELGYVEMIADYLRMW